MAKTPRAQNPRLSVLKRIEVNPVHAFAVGLAVIPSFVFQSSLLFKWIQVVLFMVLTLEAGKRIKLLPAIIMITGVVAANLLTPFGRVLWSVGNMRITLGALQNGLDRASLLIGMIYISRFSVRKGFVLPGRVGALLSLVFFYLEKILEGAPLSRGNLVEKIDERIISVRKSYTEFVADRTEDTPEATSAVGAGYLLGIVILNWSLFIYAYLIGFP